jgi:hypothetical protein
MVTTAQIVISTVFALVTTTQIVISLIIAFALGVTLAYFLWKQRKEAKTALEQHHQPAAGRAAGSPSIQLQLQAYERLILLADRIALPNLISRVNQPGLSGKDMQIVLTTNIRQEFEHNVTQQIYVTTEAWEAVRNLKDQNLLIINQVASFLPAEASGQDLNRAILEMLVQTPKASLHNIVSDVLSYEAKKLMS